MNKIDLSQELRSILKATWEANQNMHLDSVSTEAFLYNMLEHYYEHDSGKGDFNKSVSEFLDIPDKEAFFDEIKNLFKGIAKGSVSPFNGDYWTELPNLEPQLCDVLDEARQTTKNNFPERFETIEVDALLLAILKDPESNYSYKRIFEKYGLTAEKLGKLMAKNKPSLDALSQAFMEIAKEMLGEKKEEDNNNNFSQDQLNKDEENFEKYGDNKPVSGREYDPNSATPVLDQFSTDMTRDAKEGKYDPVIGRDDVVEEVIEILCKRKKPNVCLTGLPGVGKSSIVELLAQRLADEKVPRKLLGKQIRSLNLNDLVAGTKYRGEYEERLQKIIKEVCSHPEIIIYIDEIHNLIGNGGSSGSGDGANILKPYLARGEFQCIGSTTSEEYRKSIEKDAALNRRFSCVEVEEPDLSKTLKILKGVQKKYEDFHKVKFSGDVLEACVEWSNRYITDKHQPDKAIDILDLTGSLVSLKPREEDKELAEKRAKLKELQDEQDRAVMEDGDFEKGDNLRKQCIALKAEMAKMEDPKVRMAVTIDDVAQAVGKISKVPIEKVRETDRGKLKKMKQELEKKVIGQDKAVDIIVKAIQKNILGLRNPKKPIASILACGPTGVGKTLICEEVANIFFGSEKALIRIDGGTLKESVSVTSLIGASAGYIGYDDPPKLLEVKRRPRCVLLIDEVEKMHQSIYDIFLNILDAGYCNLADGTRVDFTNAIIIFTGNIGTKEIKNKVSVGFGGNEKSGTKNDEIVKKAIEKTFKPEFINRINSIVVFNELGEEELKKIFALELGKIKKALGKSKVNFTVQNKLRDYIIGLCTEGMGARELARNIEKWVTDPLSEYLLEDTEHNKFEVSLEDGKSVVKVK